MFYLLSVYFYYNVYTKDKQVKNLVHKMNKGKGPTMNHKEKGISREIPLGLSTGFGDNLCVNCFF
ncbi:MAG TPA: hypothetical protein DD412_06050 [Holosporales bacterium]|nr:hypothetical protein [Holosporales bacterium]